MYGSSPLWTRMCICRIPGSRNTLRHAWHLYSVCPVWWSRRPAWVPMCLDSSLLFRKLLPHSVHLYLPAWMFLWEYRAFRHEKCFSHWLQEYKSSPVCFLLWVTRLSDLVDRLLQTLHSNGFCPEWLCLCRTNSYLLAQHLPHSVHLHLLVWVFVWFDKASGDKKRISHWLQEYKSSPVCLLLWATRLPGIVNRLLQTVHSNGFCPEWLCLCLTNPYLLVQHFPHSVHLYLPVWMFLWAYRPLEHEKCFSHWLQYQCSPACLLLRTFKLHFFVHCLSFSVQRYCFSLRCFLWYSFKLSLAQTFGLGSSSHKYSVVSLLSASQEFSVQVNITDEHCQTTRQKTVIQDYFLCQLWKVLNDQ